MRANLHTPLEPDPGNEFGYDDDRKAYQTPEPVIFD